MDSGAITSRDGLSFFRVDHHRQIGPFLSFHGKNGIIHDVKYLLLGYQTLSSLNILDTFGVKIGSKLSQNGVRTLTFEKVFQRKIRSEKFIKTVYKDANSNLACLNCLNRSLRNPQNLVKLHRTLKKLQDPKTPYGSPF